MIGEKGHDRRPDIRTSVVDCTDMLPVGGATDGQCPGTMVFSDSNQARVECPEIDCNHPLLLLRQAALGSTVTLPGVVR